MSRDELWCHDEDSHEPHTWTDRHEYDFDCTGTHSRVNGWCMTCGGLGINTIHHVDLPRPYVFGRDMLKALHEAGLLPSYPNCSRVVIDIRPNELVMFYVEEIPNEALLNIVPLMKEAIQDGSVD